MTYNDAVLHAWLTDYEIAEFFGVTIPTVRRWKKHNKAPVGVVQALKLIAGDCPVLSKKSGWNGWSFSGGFLWSPERTSSHLAISERQNWIMTLSVAMGVKLQS